MSEQSKQYGSSGPIADVIILGAGASGLLCGATAARRGKRVLILDQADQPGRKLLATGGGKCNFSNIHMESEHFTGENTDFCRSALARFTPEHMLDMLGEAGIAVEEREHGQLFCARSAKDLRNLLLKQCREAGCVLALEEKIVAADSGPAGFTVYTRSRTPQPAGQTSIHDRVHAARSMVVATGGPAWPQVGATGTGYEIARTFGHRIVSIRPALCGLIMPESWALAGLAGISLPAGIRQGSSLASSVPTSDNLPLLFTHRGISGPAALQTSLHWHKGSVLEIDFLPALPLAQLLDAPGAGKSPVRGLLRRHLPDRLSQALVPPEYADKKVAELSRQQREHLHELVHHHAVTPTGTEGFARAEVTAGGVSTEEFSSRSMESKRVPGLFFCGEVLDITGRLGGYNLHWAFASGLAAGEHV